MNNKNKCVLLPGFLFVILFAAGCCGPTNTGESAPAPATAVGSPAPATATTMVQGPAGATTAFTLSVYVLFGDPGVFSSETAEYKTTAKQKVPTKLHKVSFVPTEKQIIAHHHHVHIFTSDSSMGGGCTGRGICQASTAPFSVGNQNAILVTFTYNTNNPNTLVMSFSMSQLRAAQPQQWQYFSAASNTYLFDDPYPVDDFIGDAFLPSDFWIYSDSPGQLQLGADGDTMTDTITFGSSD